MRLAQALMSAGNPTVVVLDLETGTDQTARAMLPLGSRSGGMPHFAQMIRSGSALVAREAGTDVRVEIRSWLSTGLEEDLLIAGVGDLLTPLAEQDALLVTYNGKAHDLPLLRRRLCRHMVFGNAGLTHWVSGTGRHLDLMTDIYPSRGKWPSLAETCAGYGIPMPEPGSRGGEPAHVRKSQIDCAMTYLAYLHELSATRGDGRPLLAGWRGLAAEISRQGQALAHLATLKGPAGVRGGAIRRP